MEGRVERLALGVELLDAVALEHGDQLRVHEPYALGQVLLLVTCRLKRTLEVVDHGQQLAHEPALRALARRRRLLGGALAEVLEVRLRALGQVEVLLPLPLCLRERVVVLSLGLLDRIRALGLGFALGLVARVLLARRLVRLVA